MCAELKSPILQWSLLNFQLFEKSVGAKLIAKLINRSNMKAFLFLTILNHEFESNELKSVIQRVRMAFSLRFRNFCLNFKLKFSSQTLKMEIFRTQPVSSS